MKRYLIVGQENDIRLVGLTPIPFYSGPVHKRACACPLCTPVSRGGRMAQGAPYQHSVERIEESEVANYLAAHEALNCILVDNGGMWDWRKSLIESRLLFGSRLKN